MKDYCPACAREVEYEGAGYDASCSICGRTKSAAEGTVVSREERARAAKRRRVWIALAVIGTVAFLGFYISIGGSDRVLETAIATAVQGLGLVALLWLFNKMKK